MRDMTIRHFTEADIPVRTELLSDSRYLSNLNDRALLTEDEQLAADQRATMETAQATERIFTICGRAGQVIGFVWITTIDWRSRSCELSIAMLPRYRRSSYGLVALRVAYDYLHGELNMRVVVNQVLKHNTMLHSPRALAANHQVVCPFDSYTVGQWRTACYWSQDERQFRAAVALLDQERLDLARRIRSAAGRSAP